MAARDEDDWRSGVEPLAEPRRVVRTRPRAAPVPLGPISMDESAESGEELAYVRSGYSPAMLRKLRRGHWMVEDSIDLHGLNRAQAATAVREFLRSVRARRLGCVRIVHGKGLGSRNREPVLKKKVHQWLRLRDEVVAFAPAPAAHGGAGALLVLLKT